MIKIRFEDKLYDLPSTWDEVKIYQFQQIKKLDYAELGKLKYVVKLIQIFTELPEDVIIRANLNTLSKIYEVIEFIYKEPLPTKMTNQFKIGEDVYTLKEFSDLNVGERISLEVLLENPIDDIFPEMMSILFKKNDEEFDAGKMNDIADDIATEVGIGQLYGVLLFFCEIERKFLDNIQRYLEDQKEMIKMKEMTMMKRMIYKMKKKISRILVYIGGALSTHWQKGTSWTMRKYIKRTLSQP
jgi:hypothetical protein